MNWVPNRCSRAAWGEGSLARRSKASQSREAALKFSCCLRSSSEDPQDAPVLAKPFRLVEGSAQSCPDQTAKLQNQNLQVATRESEFIVPLRHCPSRLKSQEPAKEPTDKASALRSAFGQLANTKCMQRNVCSSHLQGCPQIGAGFTWHFAQALREPSGQQLMPAQRDFLQF